MGASMVWENSCASHLTLTYSLAAAGWGNAHSCCYSCSFRGVFEVTYLTFGAGRSFQEPQTARLVQQLMAFFTFNVALGQTRVGCILEVVCANLKVANSNPVLHFCQLLRSLCFPRRLVQKFESKQTWRVSKLMVSGALWCHGANTSKRYWGLCFPGDILLITADSRLENCRSRIPLSRNVFSRRCAEAKFPCCLLELEWKQIQFFPWGLANSILCPSSHLSCLPLPPPPPHPAAVPGTCELLCTR